MTGAVVKSTIAVNYYFFGFEPFPNPLAMPSAVHEKSPPFTPVSQSACTGVEEKKSSQRAGKQVRYYKIGRG